MPIRTSRVPDKDKKRPHIDYDLKNAILDQKSESELFKGAIFSCLNDLIADIPEIKALKDSKLLKIFQWVYNKRKKSWKYKLRPDEADKIMQTIISEFNEKRSKMESYKWKDYRRRIQMRQYFGRFDNDQYEKNIPKKVFTAQELNEFLENDDVLTATLIMCELEDYKLTLDLAKTLAMLWVFNPGNNKTIDDMPDFLWLSKEDKEYLCDMSKQINRIKKSRHDWLSLQDEIEAHFAQKQNSANS